MIDVGAAGKGCLVDIISAILQQAGVAEFVVDAGGDLRHCGEHGIRVGLEHPRDPLLEAVDLHGAHDFRHTFATWLEDAGIPARVIDEVMGHEATSRAGQQRGSAMGALYRHTTREMAARIATAIEQRLTVVLEVAERGPAAPLNTESALVATNRVFWQISGNDAHESINRN